MFPEFANIFESKFASEDADLLPNEKTILISQSATDSTFILHHFISSYLRKSREVTILALSQSFGHYTNIGNKIGLNLKEYADKVQFTYIDGLKTLGAVFTPNVRDQVDAQNPFYHLIKDGSIIEVLQYLGDRIPHNGIFIIDDISILLNLGVKTKQLVFLIHYLQQLTKRQNSSLLLLMTCPEPHVIDEDSRYLLNNVWHRSDYVIVAKGLESGYCKDVHGQISFYDTQHDNGQPTTFQYKILDKNISVFASGLSSAVL